MKWSLGFEHCSFGDKPHIFQEPIFHFHDYGKKSTNQMPKVIGFCLESGKWEHIIINQYMLRIYQVYVGSTPHPGVTNEGLGLDSRT